MSPAGAAEQMRMDAPVMTGMMAKDADVAWACAMIPHHRSAVEMSQVLLRTGDNPETKKIAEKTKRSLLIRRRRSPS